MVGVGGRDFGGDGFNPGAETVAEVGGPLRFGIGQVGGLAQVAAEVEQFQTVARDVAAFGVDPVSEVFDELPVALAYDRTWDGAPAQVVEGQVPIERT